MSPRMASSLWRHRVLVVFAGLTGLVLTGVRSAQNSNDFAPLPSSCADSSEGSSALCGQPSPNHQLEQRQPQHPPQQRSLSRVRRAFRFRLNVPFVSLLIDIPDEEEDNKALQANAKNSRRQVAPAPQNRRKSPAGGGVVVSNSTPGFPQHPPDNTDIRVA